MNKNIENIENKYYFLEDNDFNCYEVVNEHGDSLTYDNRPEWAIIKAVTAYDIDINSIKNIKEHVFDKAYRTIQRMREISSEEAEERANDRWFNEYY